MSVFDGVDSRYGDFVAMMKPMVEYGAEFGKLDSELIDFLPKSLKLIAAGGAGFDWADHEELGRHGMPPPYELTLGIWYCNGAGAVDEATSDIALYLIIAVFRLTSKGEITARSRNPKKYNETHNLLGRIAQNPRGKILGCVGLGMIGAATARKVRGSIGMEIHYYDPVRAPKYVEEELQLTYHENLDDVLAIADCINVSVPLLPQTKHLINKETIAKMRHGVRIVNTARGKVVDEEALIEGLKSGKVFSAGLDVHYDEPNVLSPRTY
jgi:lactate dehydrogenase-like 2-hydroxyacid dehydrogenase